MSRRTSKATDDASPFAALDRAVQQSIQPPKFEDGWRSTDEIAKELGVSIGATRRRLTEWRKENRVEVWEGWVDNGRDERTRTVRFRVKG